MGSQKSERTEQAELNSTQLMKAIIKNINLGNTHLLSHPFLQTRESEHDSAGFHVGSYKMSVRAAFSPGGSAGEGYAPTVWAAFRSLLLFFAGCWLLFLKSSSRSLTALGFLCLHRLCIMSAKERICVRYQDRMYTT